MIVVISYVVMELKTLIHIEHVEQGLECRRQITEEKYIHISFDIYVYIGAFLENNRPQKRR